MDDEFAEEILNIAYGEGLRGLPFEEWMLNPYAMDQRWVFKVGFTKGLNQYKRNTFEDLVLNNKGEPNANRNK